MTTTHYPYTSLEQWRIAKMDEYIGIYTSDVIVQEKIHGSNISIVGTWDGSIWNFQLGSRKRWIEPTEKFNNLQHLFKIHQDQIIALFNDIYMDRQSVDANGDPNVIRLYGEVYGGQYGGDNANGAVKTQREPNYCPFNDFAFFDIYVDEIKMPVLEMIERTERHELKVAPVIYTGPLATFLETFDVNTFQSVVSKKFYDLDFLVTPKATEGVTIRTTNPDAVGDETTIMKFKQTWAAENPRLQKPKPPQNNYAEQITDCVGMLNENRIISYKSKNTLADITNPKLIVTHVKNIVADTMKDIGEEFPVIEYPELNRKEISKKLSKIAFQMFKKYIDTLSEDSK
jgi:Rnl2 family RNA ligase